MYIDVHAHLNNEKMVDNIDQFISNAKNYRVERIINASNDLETTKLTLEIVKQYENVYGTLGIHPEECFEYGEEFINLVKNNLENQKIVAIGEIGLDYHDLDVQIDFAIKKFPNLLGITKEEFIKKQKDVFIKQIELAHMANLPIVIHSRDATGDILEILKTHQHLITNGALIHCFSGSVETAKEFIKMGYYLSVGGVLTFKNARSLPDVIREIGIDKVLLETDCPFLSPEPYRGKLNEPKNVVFVADKLADILDIPYAEVEKITTKNAYELFGRLKW